MKKIYIIALMIVAIPSISYCQSSSDLVKTISEFQSTLNKEELELARFKFEDSLRTKWTKLPVGLAERKGIRYGDLKEESKIRFHDILSSIFSSQGYLKTTNIMHLDDYLLEIYEIAHSNELINDQVIAQLRTFKWGQGSYYISIWGNILEDDVWGFKFEGHHISLNITSVNGQLSTTPLFLGTDPALVRVTQNAGMRPLS